MTVSDHLNNGFGIQWQRYWNGAPYPELIKTVAHVAFEVDYLAGAPEGQHVIIEPNSPSPRVRVALMEVNGAPVDLMRSVTRSASTRRALSGAGVALLERSSSVQALPTPRT